MTWVILTGEYPPQPGGVSDYTRRISRGLAMQGDEVRIYAPACTEPTPKDAGVEVVRLPGHFGPAALRILSGALQDLSGPHRILVQYVPHAFGWKSMNLLFCLWLYRHRRESIWVMFHEVAFPRGTFWTFKRNLLAAVTRRMAILVARSTERVLVSIPAWELPLRKWVPKLGNVTWCPIPSNTPEHSEPSEAEHIHASLCPMDGGQVIGHFGTYGHEIASQLSMILPPLLEENPARVALLLGRGGPAFTGKIKAKHPRLTSRLVAPGELSPAEVANHLSACDLLVYPFPDGASSRRTSLMAGLALGLPIVTTEGALSEPLWRESQAVALVSVGAPELATEAVNSLLADPERRIGLGARAARLYREQFSLARTIATLRTATEGKKESGN